MTDGTRHWIYDQARRHPGRLARTVEGTPTTPRARERRKVALKALKRLNPDWLRARYGPRGEPAPVKVTRA